MRGNKALYSVHVYYTLKAIDVRSVLLIRGNLRCFGLNYNISQNTHFMYYLLCFFCTFFSVSGQAPPKLQLVFIICASIFAKRQHFCPKK